jgi:CheY-like chemotaxis protein
MNELNRNEYQPMRTQPLIKVGIASMATVLLAGVTNASPLSPDNAKQNTTYEELRSFLTNAVGNPNYWVSYEMEMPGNPAMRVEQWLKDDKIRTDMRIQGTNARLYFLGQEAISCISQGSNWTCLKMPSLDQMMAMAPGVQGIETLEEIKNNPQDYRDQITAAGTRVIAGETTSCFKMTEPESSETWLSCYSNNHGIPMYMEGQQSNGTWKMTATDFRISVQDSQFSLPAQPQSIPGMPSGF